MSLIDILQKQSELLSFCPLLDYLQEIENSDVKVIFQNKHYCYLENEHYYYKIKYKLSNLESYEIGIADKNFLPVRYTSFNMIPEQMDLPYQNYIMDHFLDYQNGTITATEKSYSYIDNELQEVSNRQMKLSPEEMNQLFSSENRLDLFGKEILHSLEQYQDDITALRIKIDCCASGNEFIRLSMGPLRHRFAPQPLEKTSHIHLVKEKQKK